MAKSKNNTEEILVKVDQNNLIYIDPNSVVKDGNIESRGINQENLVMYVNLEADIVPRSILTSGNDQNTLTNIAKGTLNFLQNKEGKDYDTKWTDTYVSNINNDIFTKADESGQSFGIDSINIEIKGFNAIPKVDINFIDVRGKTLFESPENSPYKAFFHIPWPIFYLTVKGFYGKAIKYRLHLVKFSSKFNDTNGNFEISTTFVGSTYAYLTDIPLQGVLNAAYMFPVESTTTTSTNTGTNQVVETVVKSTRGYSTLKSIYGEYKNKGLIHKDFPIKTLGEVITASHAIDKILEKEIFQFVDMRLFSGLKEFEDSIDDFALEVRAWGRRNLSNIKADISTNDTNYYGLNGNDKRDTTFIFGNQEKSLEYIINKYKEKINKTKLLSEKLINQTRSKLDQKTIGTGNIGNVDYYVYIKDFVYVKIDELVDNIYDIKRNFNEQRDILENDVENKMNEIVRRKDSGFGFEPTIRNIFAIILANAETYVRLMKDVHNRAFDVGEFRKNLLYGFTEETAGEPIYPWPEIKINSDGKENVITYPGDTTLLKKLQSDDPVLWPEVDFVENYIGVTTNRLDNNTQKEGSIGKINYEFNSNADANKIKSISSAVKASNVIPYIDKVQSNFIYEIWERAYNYCLVDSFENRTIQELADFEFSNIKESISEDIDLISLLKENANNLTKFKDLLYKIAPFEKYSYYEDNLPTTSYLKDFYVKSHRIEKYGDYPSSVNNDKDYVRLQENLINYKSEEYRTNIFPFTSDLYNQYLKSNDSTSEGFTKKDLQFNGELQVNTKEGLVSSPINPSIWVKSGYTSNLFSQRFTIDDKTSSHILNTPYFHKQLYGEFHSSSTSFGKYVGSAYLLLNSLPFVDLDEMVNFGLSTKTPSSLFREISASHYIPYHLMLKWGSIYHRYKKYILDNEDILQYFVTSGETTPINSDEFFGISGDTPTAISIVEIGSDFVSNVIDVGIHPYYDAIYHQLINGYSHYTISEGSPSFENNVNAGAIICRKRTTGNDESMNYWTSFVDNSKFVNSDKYYTLLPSDGSNSYIDKTSENGLEKTNQDTMTKGNQIYFRSLWEDTYVNSTFEGISFPETNRSLKNDKNTFGITDNNRKIIDLVGTFSPSILEDFENEFLKFASEKETFVSPDKTEYVYPYFQDLLKALVTVEKKTTDNTNIDVLITDLRLAQLEKLKTVTQEILNTNNLVKLTLGNPKEIDPYVFHGFADINQVNKFSTEKYVATDLNSDNLKLIKLYIGEEAYTGTTPTTYYTDFFEVNDVKINEENIITFRPLVLIYAGYVKAGGTNTSESFKNYIKFNVFIKNSDQNSNVGGSENRLNVFLDRLLPKFTELTYEQNLNRLTITDGYNNKPLKTELYNFFKSFNDKWVAGNSIGQRNILEEFLFLDKSNRDIGDLYFLNITRLKDLADEKNSKTNLYSAISSLIAGTGFDMRPLPAYVNFYGTNYSPNKSKITPSKKVAENLFGTFLDVDYQESSPKIIIQYVSSSSKRPDMPDKKKYRFTDDSFNISNTSNNPLMYSLPKVFKTGDLSKSNRVVAFEVSFGDQNQSIFKGVTLDQTTIKNTSESFVVLENLGRTESGSSAYNVDIGLYEYYRQASYQCEVSCMGNVMIQPTMFFYLKNIPMFKGSYWITEVSHTIKNNVINTTFKGSRIPYTSLPDPKDSFVSSYRVLFDKLIKKAETRVNGVDKVTQTSEVLKTNEGSFTFDKGNIIIPNETTIQEAAYTNFGIPFNGYDGERFIQKITHPSGIWLRANVIKMDGPIFKILPDTSMKLVTKLTNPVGNESDKVSKLLWNDFSDKNSTSLFYSTNFNTSKVNVDNLFKSTTSTTFYNPNPKGPKGPFKINHIYSLGVSSIKNVQGPIDVGPNLEGYGIALSGALMKKLGVVDGDVIYFWVDYK